MYKYEDNKSFVFSEEGQKVFLSIRDKKDRLMESSGAAKMENLISGNTGNGWDLMACVDRLVELDEIKEITGSNIRGQDRVFISTNIF